MLDPTPTRRALGAASLLACLAGAQATAAAPGARVPSAPVGHVTDLSTLPSATSGRGVVAEGTDALSPAAVDAARRALTPGYRSASLHRDGVVVERTGTVAGDSVTFAPGAVVTGSASGDAVSCGTLCLTYATLSPKHQIVNGQGYGPGIHQVNLFLDGSRTIAAAREITVPFATCSAYQCETIVHVGATTGTSRHAFAPLGCDQSRTVWGTVKYGTGWVNDSATVQIDNPGC